MANRLSQGLLPRIASQGAAPVARTAGGITHNANGTYTNAQGQVLAGNSLGQARQSQSAMQAPNRNIDPGFTNSAPIAPVANPNIAPVQNNMGFATSTMAPQNNSIMAGANTPGAINPNTGQNVAQVGAMPGQYLQGAQNAGATNAAVNSLAMQTQPNQGMAQPNQAIQNPQAQTNFVNG